jgi:hypothetical protein
MNSPHTWSGTAHPSAPPPAAPPPAGPGVPVPPVTVVVATALAVMGVVGLVVASVADIEDLFSPLEWRDEDARIVIRVVTLAAGAGLVAGAVAAVARRGGGLLRAAGAGLAALALAVLVLELAQDADLTRTVSSALMAVVGSAIALLAGLRPSRGWYEVGERAAAERAIARALAPGAAVRVDRIPGRGVGWALAAAVVGVAVVGGAALVVGQLAPPLATAEQDRSWFGEGVLSDGAEEVPVDRSDYDWDPRLDRLAESCAEGSFRDCDDLYWQSDVDTDYENYGSTCGGRIATPQRGDCVTRFD